MLETDEQSGRGTAKSGKCKVMARPGAGELLGAGVDNRGGRKQTETTGHV